MKQLGSELYMDNNDSNNNTGRGMLLFSNRKYVFALGTFLLNLQKYVSYDGVIVYHDGITIEEQESLRRIESHLKFIKYGLDEFVDEFGLDKEKIESCRFVKIYTALSVVKFKIFKHLAEFPTMVLFDLDMLLLDDMEDLLKKDFDVAWRNSGQTIRAGLGRRGFDDAFFKRIGMYEFYDKTLIPNAGFVVAKRTFDYNKAYEEGVAYLKRISFQHPFHIDEILLAYIKERMHLNAYYVDKKVYNVWPNAVCIKSKLVHFMGDYKPWNHQTVQAIFREWRINYEKFAYLTGITSKEVVDYSDISRCLLQAYCRERWNKLFYNYGFTYPRELRMEPYLSEFYLTFSYYGIMNYKIELDQWSGTCCCVCWFDKKNINIPVQQFREGFKKIVELNKEIFFYNESDDRCSIKTSQKNLGDIPDVFYHLYDVTKEFKNIPVTTYAEISTYHGSKLYVDLKNSVLLNAHENGGVEVYTGINGNKIALFIKIGGINVYIKRIEENGKVILTSQQTFFNCIHNSDRSISIEVKDGSMLSAGSNGNTTLRRWNREWEHLSVQVIGSIAE